MVPLSGCLPTCPLAFIPAAHGVCSELGLIPCLRVAGSQLVAAAALAAVPIVGHVCQRVRADEVHDVVQLQPCVWGWVDQDIGQSVLVVIHLICQRREGDGGQDWQSA